MQVFLRGGSCCLKSYFIFITPSSHTHHIKKLSSFKRWNGNDRIAPIWLTKIIVKQILMKHFTNQVSSALFFIIYCLVEECLDFYLCFELLDLCPSFKGVIIWLSVDVLLKFCTVKALFYSFLHLLNNMMKEFIKSLGMHSLTLSITIFFLYYCWLPFKSERLVVIFRIKVKPKLLHQFIDSA